MERYPSSEAGILSNGGSKSRGYQNLACNKITNEEMNCRGAKIDLKAGKINNQVAAEKDGLHTRW